MGGSLEFKGYNGYFIRNFIEIPSNVLFISSRVTNGQILGIKLLIATMTITTTTTTTTTTTIIIIIIMIILPVM